MNNRLDPARIEERIDKTVASGTEIVASLGGIQLENLVQVMELSKMLAIASKAIPSHLRNEPGMCLAVCIQALEWRMSPLAVANKSYVVNDRLAYESQLIHALIETRAPLQARLRCEYTGEGPERRCIVRGLFKNEKEPHVYESPKLRDIKVKNSPLWSSDPDQQLFYYSARSWARKWCPEVVLGIYAEDELPVDPNARMTDVTPSKPDVRSRLARKPDQRGFDHENVVRQLPQQQTPETVTDLSDDAPALAAVEASGEPQRPPAPTEAESSSAGVTSDGVAPAERSASDAEVEAEIAAKKQALSNVTSYADLNDVIATVTTFLKEHKRTDLLSDFLSAAQARRKRLKS